MIVKQIIEKGGGKIYVRSDGVGKGSTFTFYMKMQAVPDMSEIFSDRAPNTNNIKLKTSSINQSKSNMLISP